VHIYLPTPLHAQLRHRALDEDLTVKDAAVAAIEAWVTPGEREAQVVRQVLAILDLRLSRAETGERILALANLSTSGTMGT
jgi:hypothetical protein